MTDSDRTRVGHALDLVRDALAPLVDAAMTAAYGDAWDDRIATEDARRRGSGRKHPVSKTDLAVLLKVVQHERIAPWWRAPSDPAGRIRSYASELLTLRNLHAHGDECAGEYGRLLDTARRFLGLLGLAVPAELDAAVPAAAVEPVASPTPIVDDRLTLEVERLGPIAVRLIEMWKRSVEIEVSYGELAARADTPDQTEHARDVVADLGAEVLDLFDEASGIAAQLGPESPALRALALVTCAEFAGYPHGHLVVLYADILMLRATGQGLREVGDALAVRMDRLAAATRTRDQLWAEVALLCRRLNDGDLLPNILMVLCNFERSATAEPEEALALTRDSVARARMLAASDPGSSAETNLVRLLRREGALCNDLGRTDEAMRAFARADEIIDRYPAADPDL